MFTFTLSLTNQNDQHMKNYQNQDEYFNRVFFWKIDFKGTLHVPARVNFHPTLFKGTQKEYDEIYNNHLKGREDEFKITGEHKFDSLEEYNKKFPTKSIK